MPRGPRSEKRPADVIGNAVKVRRIATGEETEELETDRVKSAAAELSKPPANGRWTGLFAWDESCGGKHGGKINAHG